MYTYLEEKKNYVVGFDFFEFFIVRWFVSAKKRNIVESEKKLLDAAGKTQQFFKSQ